ncbi:MAG: hypothetical protein JW774_09945 [Candidatus Aureabacteria bacterium]|nr:hypothetical protein [Candidatus Auribacterota bacterium]
MLNLICTADYELFFSKNNNPEEILIQPTDRLLKIFSKYQQPITLFADVCCILRLKELGDDFAFKMEEQLISAVRCGHDVQLHVHPHWLFADFNNGEWSFDKKYYKIQNLGFDRSETDIRKSGYALLKNAKKYLENLLTSVNPDYKCIAFRAGGWCIQPELEYTAALSELGITIDSSVIYGGKSMEEMNSHDFTDVPKGNYFFKDNIHIKINQSQGALYEVPVIGLTFPWNLVKFLHIRMLTPKKNHIFVKNMGNFVVGKNKKPLINKIISRYFSPLSLTFDAQIYEDNLHILNRYINKNSWSSAALISHPKIFCDGVYQEIDTFVKTVVDTYKNTIRLSLFNAAIVR